MNMTRFFLPFLAVLAAAIPAAAHDFVNNNIYYNITSNNTVEVTYCDGAAEGTTYSGNVNIPSSVYYNGKSYQVSSIGSNAFRHSPGLTSVTFPGTLKTIGDHAFWYCYGLTSVNFPNSLKTIGFAAFAFCGMESLVIPNSVTTIDPDAFNGCNSLISVTIGVSVSTLGEMSFANCTALQTVNWNATSCSSDYYTSTRPFKGCNAITAFNIGDNVTRIPDCLCFNLNNLSSVTIPNKVTSLGLMCFAKCYALNTVIIGKGVTTFADSVFYNCTALETILPRMTAPASLNYGIGIFDGVNKQDCMLFVPRGTLSQYKNTMPWKEFLYIEQQGGVVIVCDVNCDGSVTAADVTAIYDILLGNSSNFEATADVNGDGNVTAADVTCVYDILLGNVILDNSVTEYEVLGVRFKMVDVDGCTFAMGNPNYQSSTGTYDEGPVHQVTLSSFEIGQTEVTQELWQAIMGYNPSYYSGSNLPVEKVSWNQCQAFISLLNQILIIDGYEFRLPTEAQWEYAARGGNKSQGYLYSGSNNIGTVAWYQGNSGSKTHQVATKAPNELGLYDMSGNVEEWCQDHYGDYTSQPQTDPDIVIPTHNNPYNLRGGFYSTEATKCRNTQRDSWYADQSDKEIGFRLVLVEKAPQ